GAETRTAAPDDLAQVTRGTLVSRTRPNWKMVSAPIRRWACPDEPSSPQHAGCLRLPVARRRHAGDRENQQDEVDLPVLPDLGPEMLDPGLLLRGGWTARGRDRIAHIDEPLDVPTDAVRPQERRDRREHRSDRQDEPEVGAQPIAQGAEIVEIAEPNDPSGHHGRDPQAGDHLRDLALLHGDVQERTRGGTNLGCGRPDEPDEQERGPHPEDSRHDVQETEHDHERVGRNHPSLLSTLAIRSANDMRCRCAKPTSVPVALALDARG